ncbi:ABC transporter permease [Thalassobacillus devorans]|uniref:ABC transporter permease n=1 Tax=Thalassobacillus devorans TaxID=279813 RepID=UPI000A1C8D8A|nr:ABC transporter permease [Thalassobacillus devorans]
MGTQLRLQSIWLMQRWRSLLFLIFFPFVCVVGVYPFLSATLSGSQIPVGWVDKDNTQFSSLVYERLGENEHLNLKKLDLEEAKRLVQIGELEAAFLMDAGFEEQLRTGETEEKIRWLRSEDSTFDAFAKEKVASEVTRLLLNSKAAQFAAEYQGDSVWEETFTQADSYWQPEPLFQMDFHWVSGLEKEKETIPLVVQGVFSILLVYLMGAATYLYLPLFHDRRTGLLTRMKLTSGHVYSYYAVLFLLSFSLLLGVTFIVLTLVTFVFQISWTLLLPSLLKVAGVISIVHACWLVLAIFVKNHRVFISITAVIIVVSFLLGGIPLESVDSVFLEKWLPHGWLFHQIWLEGLV